MPRSKKAVKVPSAEPRRDSETLLIATSEREGYSKAKAMPIPTAPASARGRAAARISLFIIVVIRV